MVGRRGPGGRLRIVCFLLCCSFLLFLFFSFLFTYFWVVFVCCFSLSCSFLKTKHVSRIILVTSDYHMARASDIFQKAMPHIELVKYPVPSEFSNTSWIGIRKFLLEYWKHALYSVGLLQLFSSLRGARSATKQSIRK